MIKYRFSSKNEGLPAHKKPACRITLDRPANNTQANLLSVILRFLFLPLNRLIHLFAVYWDMRRGIDAEANFFTSDVDNGDLDVVADDNCFVSLS